MPRQVECAVLALACVVAAQAQSSAFKTFHDSASAVSFLYPAEWSSGDEVAFYLGALILLATPSDNGPDAPEAKVGFNAAAPGNPFAGTNLNGIQFVYHVTDAASAADCGKRIAASEDDKQKAVQTAIHGVVYHRFKTGDAGLGHQASREIYSTFQTGHCYMFEEDIQFLSFSDGRTLSASQLKHLRNQLDAVMHSVRIRHPRE